MIYYRCISGRTCMGIEVNEDGFVTDASRSARWLVGRMLPWILQWGSYNHWKIHKVRNLIQEIP